MSGKSEANAENIDVNAKNEKKFPPIWRENV